MEESRWLSALVGGPVRDAMIGRLQNDLDFTTSARPDVTEVDVVGIATDHCVRASTLDALSAGLNVRVLTDLVAGVGEESSKAALAEVEKAGANLV